MPTGSQAAQDPAWVGAVDRLEEDGRVSSSARRIFRAAAEQTVDVILYNEREKVRRPSSEDLALMAARIKAAAAGIKQDDDVDPEAAVLALKSATCKEVATLFLPGSITYEELMGSRHGLDIATSVLRQVGKTLKEDVEQSRSFR